MRRSTTVQMAQRLAVLVCVLFCAAQTRDVHAADYTATKFCRTSVALVKVSQSRVIPLPIVKVWAKVRNFQKVPNLTPATVSPANKLPGDQIGSRRFAHFPGGKRTLEELTGLDDVNYIQNYRLYPDSGTNGNLSPNMSTVPFPVCNHHGMVRLYPVTLTNATFMVWEVTFLTTPKQQAVAQAGVTGLIIGFLKQL